MITHQSICAVLYIVYSGPKGTVSKDSKIRHGDPNIKRNSIVYLYALNLLVKKKLLRLCAAII